MTNNTTNTYKMKRKILKFSKKVSKGLSKSENKFVKDIEYGIAKSKSCFISEISRSLKGINNLNKPLTIHMKHI